MMPYPCFMTRMLADSTTVSISILDLTLSGHSRLNCWIQGLLDFLYSLN